MCDEIPLTTAQDDDDDDHGGSRDGDDFDDDDGVEDMQKVANRPTNQLRSEGIRLKTLRAATETATK